MREFNYQVANVFTKVLKKPKVSFSRVVKTSLKYRVKAYKRGMFGKSITVNNEYRDIIDNIGTKALQMRNSYVD